MKTQHQLRVEAFMIAAGQFVPANPIIPSTEIRRLRAELILEEALETIEALGYILINGEHGRYALKPNANVFELEPIVDGCVDLSVVTIGTLSACGVQDDPMLRLVDDNNLDKIKRGYRGPSGKWMKPADHKPPDISAELKLQGYEPA